MAAVEALRVGLLVNPVAGAGGVAALRGSDHLSAEQLPAARAARRASGRCAEFLRALADADVALQWLTWGQAMGGDVAVQLGLEPMVVGAPTSAVTDAEDTRRATRALVRAGVDVLVFVGGDGTARDVCSALADGQLCLGVPAGVKMQSGVFAVTPADAAAVIAAMAAGRLIATEQAEVRDIDEAALRQGRVRSRLHGHLRVPRAHQFVQQVKTGGRESEPLVLVEIAAEICDRMVDAGGLWVLGPGSTTMAIKEALGGTATLLGVDVAADGVLIEADVTGVRLEQLVGAATTVHLVLTPIGGQGIVFGRGNQQITPDVLRRVGRDHIVIVATRSKLLGLAGRPLRSDTGDTQLDQDLSGVWDVVTGYQDTVGVRLGRGDGAP